MSLPQGDLQLLEGDVARRLLASTVELLAHRIDPAEAKARGLAITGDVRLLRRIRPIRPGARSAPSSPAR